MSELAPWILFLAIGIGTFSLRLSFIGLHGRFRIPSRIQRALAYVPASMLAALVLPAIFQPGGSNELIVSNPKIPASLIAAIVAWKSQNILFTLIAGMGTLWVLQVFG